MIALFGGWAAVVAFGVAYAALRHAVGPMALLVGASAALAAASAALLRWIKTRGAQIFSAL